MSLLSSSDSFRRKSPSLVMADPKFGGRDEATSLFILEASLQPFPDVVMPICNGPSECVLSKVKVDNDEESTTLTGMRNRRQALDMWVPTVN
jgi:hypothetical protein